MAVKARVRPRSWAGSVRPRECHGSVSLTFKCIDCDKFLHFQKKSVMWATGLNLKLDAPCFILTDVERKKGSRFVLSNMVAPSHMWLFEFEFK